MSSALRVIFAGLVLTFMGTRAATAAPTTRPAFSVRVAVLPLQVLGNRQYEWLGAAIQQGIASGIQRGPSVQPLVVAVVSPIDAPNARATAQELDAGYVVFGSVQVIDDSMRVDGQVLATRSGIVIGSFRARGAIKDAFKVEDQISDRLNRLLMPPRSIAAQAADADELIVWKSPAAAPVESRYFDGDLARELKIGNRFADAYDRYNYHSVDNDPSAAAGFACPGFGSGFGGFGCGYPGFGYGGPGIYGSLGLTAGPWGGVGPLGGFSGYPGPIAAPLSGW